MFLNLVFLNHSSFPNPLFTHSAFPLYFFLLHLLFFAFRHFLFLFLFQFSDFLHSAPIFFLLHFHLFSPIPSFNTSSPFFFFPSFLAFPFSHSRLFVLPRLLSLFLFPSRFPLFHSLAPSFPPFVFPLPFLFSPPHQTFSFPLFQFLCTHPSTFLPSSFHLSSSLPKHSSLSPPLPPRHGWTNTDEHLIRCRSYGRR